MKKFSLLITLSSLLLALNAPAGIEQMKAEFEQMKHAQNEEFKDYKSKLDAEYKTYKKELETYWRKPELSTKKRWVSYTKDKQARSKVDFEKNNYTVEVIAKDIKSAKKKLKERISYVVSKNTKEVVKTDPLQKRVAKISRSKDVVTSKVTAKPIIAPLIFAKKPSKEDVNKYALNTLNKSKITTKKAKQKGEKVYTLTVNLPKNSTLRLSKLYAKEVSQNSQEFNIPLELVFAIIQTESDFNPFAKSHIPAFGLMQIVPRTAGKDAYRFLHKRDGTPSATYLYNAPNNIEMGSAYLHILYYRYLKKIKNPKSRLYCTIAAYNTGAGNIAWAFTHTHNMNKAAPKINRLSSDAVYEKLLQDLKYDEPKHYLKRVKKRMKIYKLAYKSSK